MRAPLLCAIAFMAGGQGLSAGDADAPAAGAMAGDSAAGFSAARRDFDAIRAAGDQAQRPRDELPQFGEARGAPAPAANRPPPAVNLNDVNQRKSSNWLLEAMARPEEAQGKGGQKPAEAQELERFILERHAPTSANLLTAAAEAEAARISLQAPPKKIEVNNPLTQFLNDWMTPQDYALLRPALEPKDALAATRAESALAAQSPFEAPAAPRTERSPVLPGDAGAIAPALPGDNPYLQILNAPAPFAGVPPPPPAVPAPITSSVPVMAPVAAPAPVAPMAPPPRLPDFVKPIGEDKYFRPLKRF